MRSTSSSTTSSAASWRRSRCRGDCRAKADQILSRPPDGLVKWPPEDQARGHAERTPPPPKEHPYRKAWVGSTSVYDAEGNELHTWRYAVEADADPNVLAERVAKDVAWIVKAHPGIPVHCVQDAAPELDRLPEALASVLPRNTTFVELVDFEHLMGYLEDVVDACEDEGDPHGWKGWYRNLLLRDDAANLPIGSGATESMCWQMQQRIKLPGRSWDTPGLRGVLATRAPVLSDRWSAAR